VRHLVVGTAGHIDHGKSALVEALTGVHPDRLDEEKRRGITIDLGFADLDLGADGVLSFVDVPGHERFVRHMVAGATGFDAVMLVVAADEGVKPQTREHLAICTLLGLGRGVVVLSKADAVDRDLREVAALELREFLAGSFLADAPVVPVSSRTREGLDRLVAALRELARTVPVRSPAGVPRLPVDRSFVLKGFGTVVTGTLASGRLCEGDEVEILPGGRRCRIRGLQVHHRAVDEVPAGCRVAANLQGVSCEEAPRGATVTHPGALKTTRRLRVRLRLLSGAPDALTRGGPVRFHHHTTDCAARLRVTGPSVVGDGLLEADLVLSRDVVVLPHDRFVLRRSAPVDTVGGGTVLDAHPPRQRRAGTAVAAPEEAESPREALAERLARAGEAGRALAELAAEIGRSAAEVEADASRLESEGRLVRFGGVAIAPEALGAVRRRLGDALAAFHAAEPLRSGMGREALRRQAAADVRPEVFRALLERMEREGVLRLLGDRVAAAAHRVVLSAADAVAADRIDRAFREAGLNPPEAEDVLEAGGGQTGRRLLDVLLEQGRLVRIRDGRVFHAEALEELRRRVREFGRSSRTMDVGTFKDLAGVTRKNAIPLLEQLDAERVTRRSGNLREILGDGAAG